MLDTKIVISSHFLYKTPLKVLLDSMKNKVSSNQVIIVIADVNILEPRIYQQDYIYIETNINGYEYTAFDMIKTFINHPLVKSEYYFFLHDTCKVGESFPSSILNMKCNPGQIVMNNIRNCNIVYLHKEVINNMKFLYGNLNKQQACALEGKNTKTQHLKSYKIRKIWQYAENVKYIGNREDIGIIDIYKTGYPRDIAYFREFDIYKYLLDKHNGDILGKVNRNEKK